MTDARPPDAGGDERAEVVRLHAADPPAPPDDSEVVPVERLSREARDERAVQLRAGYKTFREVGEVLGLTPRAARTAFERGLAQIQREISEDAARLRAMEWARLEHLGEAIYPAAAEGDIRAHEVFLKNSDARRRLAGLDLRVDSAPAGPLIVINADMPTPTPSAPQPDPVFEGDMVDDDVLELGPGDEPPA